MIRVGVVSKVKNGMVCVKLDDELETDFIGVFQPASNANSTSFKPVCVGEQGYILSNGDDLNSGAFLRGVYQNKYKLEASDTKEYTVFSDGTIISYDTSNSTLDVLVTKTINITCVDANITCTNANIKASSVKVDSPSIDLGLGGTGVITCQSICHFTGAPHGDGSSNTRSAK